jgi:hypothetical protein
MKIDLYLPYYDYNDKGANLEGYYGEDGYIKAMKEEYEMSKDVVFESMLGLNGGLHGALTGTDGQMYKFGAKTQHSEDNVAYARCGCVMYDDSGKEETVDGMISRFARQEEFVSMFELDLDGADEEFLTEMSLWKREHANISKYADKAGYEWAWANEPKRDVRGSFTNKSGEEIYVLLKNCRIMDLISESSVILFIERMTITDKF